MVFVSQQEDIPWDCSPVEDLDHIDIDKDEYDGDDCEEPEDDDDDREASSEQDTDEADNRGESAHMEAQSEKCESIHIQSSPRDFVASPMYNRFLDYAEDPEHVTSLAEEPAEEPDQTIDQEVAHNDDDNAEDNDEHESRELKIEEIHEEEFEETREEEQEDDEELEVEAPPGEDTPKADADKPGPELATTSRPASPPRSHEGGEDHPTPSPSKPKASKQGKHKDSWGDTEPKNLQLQRVL